MRKIIIFFFFVLLFGNYINNDVLLIEAKLYPKIIYLINNNDQKEKIKIAIVVDKNSYNIGNKLKKLIQKQNIKVDLINKINLKYDVYIFTFKNIDKNDLNFLLNNKKVIFTIYPNDIKNAIFGIYIGSKIYPYINLKLLQLSKTKFNPILLRVGKIYEK
jgi:hypothetical protein